MDRELNQDRNKCVKCIAKYVRIKQIHEYSEITENRQ